MISVLALGIGAVIDLIVGDPHSIPHPVVFMGRLISFLDKKLRKLFPKSKKGERLAGALLWIITASVSFILPLGILIFLKEISPWLALAAESLMCWQILAAKSLKTESMKVYRALKEGDINKSRLAVSMIVGRDTGELDQEAVTRAAVETVAENSSDGVIAPLFYLAIGGAPLGFLYKAVNTMDSMLGYVEEPYKNVGFVSAKADDIFNYIPARLSALFMLAAGFLLRLNVKNGWRIFKRDRYKHASPNSAQTEAMCAGLLGLRLAGDAFYHGVLHKKQFIGDELRRIEFEDIPRSCNLMYMSALLAFLTFTALRILIII